MKKTQHGFTLIELVVTIAILGIVSLLIYQFFSFGTLAFGRGSDKFDLQTELRLVSDYITEEIRFADQVEVLPALPGTFDPSIKYLYVNAAHRLILVENGTSSNQSEPFIQPNPQMFTLSSNQNRNTISYELAGHYRHENYELQSEAFLNNYFEDIDPSPVMGFILAYQTPLLP